MKIKIPKHIVEIAPYVPGKPIETLEREYGIADSIKLASNENPLGPSPAALAAISSAMVNLHRYPDGAGYILLNRLAQHIGVASTQIVLGNGSDDILGMLALALLTPGDEAIMPTSSFLMYSIVTQAAGAIPVKVPLKNLSIDLDGMLKAVGSRTRLIFVCNPNNPTGSMITRHALEAFMDALPEHVVVVIDEAYIDFVRDPACADGLTFLAKNQPVVTLRTFSKAYGLAGLRVGYGVMAAELAELLNRIRMPFNVNALAQAAASAALGDDTFLQKTIATVHDGLDFFYTELSRRGVRYFPTQANFFLIDVARDARDVYESLLCRGVIVRAMTAYGYPEYIRVNVGLPEENQRFLDTLDAVLTK
jgi:histidinol-phosphate aminotransferase